MKKSRLIIIGGGVLLLSACAIPSFDDSADTPTQVNSAQYSTHHYVALLAKQLFFTAKPIYMEKSVAVGTFLPTESMDGKNVPSTNELGQQIQESFVTLATQAGLNVVEFKTATAIKIQHNQDLMLSRQINEINANVQTDYYLTGTYSLQQKNIAINARLIEASSQKVIAAATEVFPSNAMWEQEKIMLKNNGLYRNAY
ncbi:FlgO family outer membrane protein [Paraglaciecola sp. L1A13]|uniref:FlgO family outer membrane protein n=1 Tax=Paraglaciecola sp. L1A13 TaxID=2686359 RepID=UPI001E52BB2C|nr:FlgO family outer membrane protein [Paraglaciecola sp. L1A13]